MTNLPSGYLYRDDFITAAEEAALVDAIEKTEFANFEMRGVVARRRVQFFGKSYDNGATPAAPMPDFLGFLRARAAAWAGVDAAQFAMALVNETVPVRQSDGIAMRPGPDFVAGISLLAPCRMKFRPYVSPVAARSSSERRMATHEIRLAPRSAYLMTGESRQAFEHSIPAVTALRYSITFRTLRATAAR